MIDSLKELHENNIMHGDARPENVVCVDGKPRWIDFMHPQFSAIAPRSFEAEMNQFLDFLNNDHYLRE